MAKKDEVTVVDGNEKILRSNLTFRVSLAGVLVCPGENILNDEQLKAVIADKDGAFFNDNGDFIVPKKA